MRLAKYLLGIGLVGMLGCGGLEKGKIKFLESLDAQIDIFDTNYYKVDDVFFGLSTMSKPMRSWKKDNYYLIEYLVESKYTARKRFYLLFGKAVDCKDDFQQYCLEAPKSGKQYLKRVCKDPPTKCLDTFDAIPCSEPFQNINLKDMDSDNIPEILYTCEKRKMVWLFAPRKSVSLEEFKEMLKKREEILKSWDIR
jgi:hypothetical protein